MVDFEAIRQGRCPLGGKEACQNPATVHARTARVCEQHAPLLLTDNWKRDFRKIGDDWYPPAVEPKVPMPEPKSKTAVKRG